jgi:hypothetical protein
LDATEQTQKMTEEAPYDEASLEIGALLPGICNLEKPGLPDIGSDIVHGSAYWVDGGAGECFYSLLGSFQASDGGDSSAAYTFTLTFALESASMADAQLAVSTCSGHSTVATDISLQSGLVADTDQVSWEAVEEAATAQVLDPCAAIWPESSRAVFLPTADPESTVTYFAVILHSDTAGDFEVTLHYSSAVNEEAGGEAEGEETFLEAGDICAEDSYAETSSLDLAATYGSNLLCSYTTQQIVRPQDSLYLFFDVADAGSTIVVTTCSSQSNFDTALLLLFDEGEEYSNFPGVDDDGPSCGFHEYFSTLTVEDAAAGGYVALVSHASGLLLGESVELNIVILKGPTTTTGGSTDSATNPPPDSGTCEDIAEFTDEDGAPLCPQIAQALPLYSGSCVTMFEDSFETYDDFAASLEIFASYCPVTCDACGGSIVPDISETLFVGVTDPTENPTEEPTEEDICAPCTATCEESELPASCATMEPLIAADGCANSCLDTAELLDACVQEIYDNLGCTESDFVLVVNEAPTDEPETVVEVEVTLILTYEEELTESQIGDACDAIVDGAKGYIIDETSLDPDKITCEMDLVESRRRLLAGVSYSALITIATFDETAKTVDIAKAGALSEAIADLPAMANVVVVFSSFEDKDGVSVDPAGDDDSTTAPSHKCGLLLPSFAFLCVSMSILDY